MVVRDGTYHHGKILNYLEGEELCCAISFGFLK